MGLCYNQIKRRFPDGIPNLDPIQDMKIKSKDFEKTVCKIEILEQRLLAHVLHKAEDRAGLMDLCGKKNIYRVKKQNGFS